MGWKERNPEKARAYRARYYAEHQEQERENHRAWTGRNPDRVRVYRRQDQPNNNRRRQTPAARARRNETERRRYSQDPGHVIGKRLRSALTQALRRARAKKTETTFDLIGCSIQELMAHLEQQFLPGMNWENREGWHVDHIRPVVSFDLTQVDQQRACFHWTNLQPLWATENQRKQARLP